MKGQICISWSALYEKEFISYMELNPVHGVGLWSTLHEREFLSFKELPYSMKGHFCISWSALHEKIFIGFMELPYSMKGNF